MTVVKQPSGVTVTQDATQLFVHPGLEVKCAVSPEVEKVALLRRAEFLVGFSEEHWHSCLEMELPDKK